mmetsp:Transcript_75080/g.217079  ORF Transcript_75080/g.217079 Transcript_75080/m.217079 type:complete len:379 (-) Transcript_75080:201-1337(-)
MDCCSPQVATEIDTLLPPRPLPPGEIDDPEYRPRTDAAQPAPPPKTLTLDLPENLYGAAMMAVVRSSQGHHRMFHGVTVCIYVAMLLNMTMQIYMLYFSSLYISRPAINYARGLYKDYHHGAFDVGGVDAWLFSEEMWKEFVGHHMAEAIEICQLPLSQPSITIAVLLIWTVACWDDTLYALHWIELWFKLPLTEDGFTQVVVSEEELVAVATAKPVKAVIVVAVLFPKIFTSMYLWVVGMRWLLSTPSFGALFLNTVGLAFLTNLGELLYSVFVPGEIQSMVQTYKLFVDREDWIESEMQVRSQGRACTVCKCFCNGPRCQRRFLRLAGRMLVTLVGIIAAPTLYMWKFQRVLPHYQWDVAAPCRQLFDLMKNSEDW